MGELFEYALISEREENKYFNALISNSDVKYWEAEYNHARGKHEGAMKAIKCLGALELFEKYKEDKEHEEN